MKRAQACRLQRESLRQTFGVVFDLWHRLRYHHAAWHRFVPGGSTCHHLAVLLFLRPRAA